MSKYSFVNNTVAAVLFATKATNAADQHIEIAFEFKHENYKENIHVPCIKYVSLLV